MAINLTVISVSWSPIPVNTGDPVLFSSVVRNTGTTATPAGVRHTVLFSVDGAPQTWSDNTTASHASLADKTYTASDGNAGATWIATPGTHTVTAFVDDENLIAESDEADNELSVQIVVDGGGGGGGSGFPIGTAVVANGRIEIGGTPYFLNGFFLVDRGETTQYFRDTLLMLSNAGFNCVLSGAPGGSENGPYLDYAESLGLKIIEEGMSSAEKTTFRYHNAIMGHHIGDDVHAHPETTPSLLLARHNASKSADPDHFTYFSDYGGSAEQSPYVGIGDVAGPYDYPVTYANWVGQVDYYINQIRLLNRPIIFGIPQAFNWSPENPSLGTRPPNAAEYRNMLYQYLINKCMGLLSYDITDNVGFQRLDTKYPSLWAECVLCAGEVNTLSNMLLNGTYTKYTTNNGVLGARWAYQGGQYVILVNPESTSRACTFTLTGGGTLQNVFSSRPAGLNSCRINSFRNGCCSRCACL